MKSCIFVILQVWSDYPRARRGCFLTNILYLLLKIWKTWKYKSHCFSSLLPHFKSSSLPISEKSEYWDRFYNMLYVFILFRVKDGSANVFFTPQKGVFFSTDFIENQSKAVNKSSRIHPQSQNSLKELLKKEFDGI